MIRKARRALRRMLPAAMLTMVGAGAVSGEPPPSMPAHGELAAAVRSSGQPCAHVVGVQPVSEQRWRVECNSGKFVVVRSPDGKLSVATP